MAAPLDVLGDSAHRRLQRLKRLPSADLNNSNAAAKAAVAIWTGVQSVLVAKLKFVSAGASGEADKIINRKPREA